jgi:hypothetical protein
MTDTLAIVRAHALINALMQQIMRCKTPEGFWSAFAEHVALVDCLVSTGVMTPEERDKWKAGLE